jgi:glutathione S-transferase
MVTVTGSYISVADIAIASFFRNAGFADFSVDAGRWPVAAAFVSRTLEHPAFTRLRKLEEIAMRTPISRHREALAEAGAPLSMQTPGTDEPRRGVLRI